MHSAASAFGDTLSDCLGLADALPIVTTAAPRYAVMAPVGPATPAAVAPGTVVKISAPAQR